MNQLIEAINSQRVEPGNIYIWWLGQEGYVCKTSELIFYIDPYISTYVERLTLGTSSEHIRMTPPPMAPEDVSHADVVICTHDHMDHIDPGGIPIIAQQSPQAQFVVPQSAAETLRGFNITEDCIHTLKGNDSLCLDGMQIHAIPAKHEEFEYDATNGYPFLSYVIKTADLSIFHAGDTIPYEGQVEKVRSHNIDLALLPINGRNDFIHSKGIVGNFSCAEAVEFALSIGATLTVPMHYDMFDINTVDVEDFRRIAESRKLRHQILTPSNMMRIP